MGRLEGKVCIITGATSGIGRESAKVFAREGAKVVFAGRREARGREVEAEIKAAGGDCLFVRTDVTIDADCDNLVKAALDTYGTIDVFFGNAGSSSFFHFEKMDWKKDYDDIFALNCRADYYLTKAILPTFMEKKSGNFIYTCSIAATQGSVYLTTYASTKAAVTQLAKSIAIEFGAYGIRANCIYPGPIITEMTEPGGPIERMFTPLVPLGRMGTCEEIANCALFLASDECRFLTGTTITVDGGVTAGMNLFPDFPDQ